MISWFRPSVVRILKIRPGKGGRWRWIGLGLDGSAKAILTRAYGFETPEEAEKDGLAVFPRATVVRENR